MCTKCMQLLQLLKQNTMKIYQYKKSTTPIQFSIAALAIAALLVTPSLTQAAPKDKEMRGNAHAHGHSKAAIHVPPFIPFLSEVKDEFDWLPPGLLKLTDKFEKITAPELESSITEVTDTAATLEFSFDESVQADLMVSTEAGFDSEDADVAVYTSDEFMTEHEFTLTDLDSETDYFYKVQFTDEDGNTVTTEEMSFTTEATVGADVQVPEIVSLTEETTDTTADIDVTFDEPATVTLLVSTVDGFEGTEADVMQFDQTELATMHEFVLSGLPADTEFFFRLSYSDEAGNATVSEQMMFTTEVTDTTGPVISNLSGEATETTITGAFTTDEPARATIYTATNSGFAVDDDGVIVTESTEFMTEHELTVTGLFTTTDYYHIVAVEDESGNVTMTDEIEFGTN